MTHRLPLLALGLFAGLVACARGVDDDLTGETLASESNDAQSPKKTPEASTDSGPPPEATGDASAGDDAGEELDGGATDATADAAPDSAPPPVTPPAVDGVIASGEYGVHTNGQNQQVSNASDPTSTTWYMTWTETHLYVGVSAANVAEGIVLYVDRAPLATPNGGTNADGSLAGVVYDGTNAGTLPMRADFVAYLKASYNEYRTANGAGGWTAPTAAALSIQTTGTTREVAIPWSVISPSGRPTSFAWLGYATSASGYVYGGVPAGNPGGNIGTTAAFGSFYRVTDATPGVGKKPFATKVSP